MTGHKPGNNCSSIHFLPVIHFMVVGNVAYPSYYRPVCPGLTQRDIKPIAFIFTLMDNSESPVAGEPGETHADKWRTCKTRTESLHQPVDLNPLHVMRQHS